MKERLDVLLVQKGYFESREKAKRVIMAGSVFVDGIRFDKAGSMVKEDSRIEVKGAVCPYVSRGGFKLKKALDVFQIRLEGCVCADMGASTGGFTDCMLQHGAKKVYSIDVGYGQLDWKLRNDSRVVNLEKRNIRRMDPGEIDDIVDFISIDVSFISLSLILPVAREVLREGGQMVCLVKPQFEAGREQVGKKGIVKDPRVHREVLERIIGVAQDLGFQVLDVTFSPITGSKGNIEYLMFVEKNSDNLDIWKINFEERISRVIIDAQKIL